MSTAWILIVILIFSWLGEPNRSWAAVESTSQAETCLKQFADLKAVRGLALSSICEELSVTDSCRSNHAQPIFHYDRAGRNAKPRRILVFGQVHGDERDAGRLSMRWIQRLQKISPQNTWRVVPRLNPDGRDKKTRMNANGVDLNRNFPTADWDQLAAAHWADVAKKDPRRFPGESAGSEPETKCAVDHIKKFQPEIVVSVHTPYGLLDFDGPKVKFPKFSNLPWVLLGNFPGSLGRYLWVDQKIPVLTVELKENSLDRAPEDFDRLQDLISYLLVTSSSTP